MSRIADTYRRVPGWLAFVTAAIASFVLAFVAGILGAFVATYFYDRGMSKGDDFAIGMGGLFAVGTFVFIVAITWLLKLHHRVSARTPSFAWLACLALAIVSTAGLWDYDYSQLILAGWVLFLVCSLGGLALCRRKLLRPPAASRNVGGSGNRPAR